MSIVSSRKWVIAAAVGILVAVLAGWWAIRTVGGDRAGQDRTYRVGIIGGLHFFDEAAEGFRSEMARLGYVEGKNISYDEELMVSELEKERERAVLERFARDGVDLIFSYPTEVSMAAKKVSDNTGIPLVFSIANIEGTDLIESISRPGGNVTGVRYPGPDLAIVRFEVLRDLAPDAKRIIVPYMEGYPIVSSQMEALMPTAEADGLTFIEVPAVDAADLEAKLAGLERSGGVEADAILIIAEPLGVIPEAFVVISEFAERHGLPFGGAYMNVDGHRSLFGASVDVRRAGEQAAAQADSVLRGIPVGDIPVVSNDRYLIIDHKAISDSGLDISGWLLKQADEIIIE
ncbi:ABC transporter substrate-binding protein [Candidatus Uhrbacteria bacterium]|nr:ABC transporter substrate-binding protein [Candidatus Uhrbacteria bacterium]